MDQGFIDILYQLVREQSSAALTDAKRCKAFLADYTRGEYKKESRLILLAVEAGMAKVIEGADVLEPCKKAFIRDLEEEGLSSTFAADIINTLALILRGDKTVTVSATVAPNAPQTDDDDDFAIYDGREIYSPPSSATSKPSPSAEELNNQGIAEEKAGNYTKAAELYRKAADLTPSNAQQSCVDDKNQHGVAHNESYQDEKRREDFSPSSAPSIAWAMNNLGKLYENGEGVPKDMAKAIELYRKAADLGNTEAMVSLGFAIYHGNGIPKDYAKAAELWQKAADMGHTGAMNNLANCYLKGLGVPTDYTKEIEWRKKAAAKGHKASQENLTKRGISW